MDGDTTERLSQESQCPNAKKHGLLARASAFAGGYLNYAKAAFKYLGSATATSADLPMSADEAVDKIRQRAGMPDFPTSLSNEEWWSKYQNERMVELAFEGHRFWDVRRWKEANKFFKNIQEMKITRNDDGSFTYTRETVQRQWDDKMYLFPIPNDVMLKHEKYGQLSKWHSGPARSSNGR